METTKQFDAPVRTDASALKKPVEFEQRFALAQLKTLIAELDNLKEAVKELKIADVSAVYRIAHAEKEIEFCARSLYRQSYLVTAWIADRILAELNSDWSDADKLNAIRILCETKSNEKSNG